LNILFDQGVPVPLKAWLGPHEVDAAFECGWSTLKNGELLAVAEKSGFDVMVSTDQKLKYQQRVTQRKMGILVLRSTSWPRIEKVAADIAKRMDSMKAGDYVEVPIPWGADKSLRPTVTIVTVRAGAEIEGMAWVADGQKGQRKYRFHTCASRFRRPPHQARPIPSRSPLLPRESAPSSPIRRAPTARCSSRSSPVPIRFT
jgi:hypothetical protein